MIDLLAYIDPGSTALIWQILAGVLIVFGVVLGIWWTKITTFFKSVWTKVFNKKKSGEERASETDEILDEISDETDKTDEAGETEEKPSNTND